jgi:hypothetical protein
VSEEKDLARGESHSHLPAGRTRHQARANDSEKSVSLDFVGQAPAGHAKGSLTSEECVMWLFRLSMA